MARKILIVEDDPETQFMMSEFMDALGYEFDLVSDGQHCMTHVEKFPSQYALILMDIHMPNLSGLEASERIRALESDPPRSTPIVLMSADSAYHSSQSAEKLGLNGALPKPVGLLDLEAKIQQYIN